MICEHWENIKDASLFDYSYCKLTGQMCYCNGVKEDCDYTEEKEKINEK